MALARYDFRKPPLLADEEVESILARVDELIAWATDIKEYALQAALRGKHWDGWKLVEGRANRRYTDEQAVARGRVRSINISKRKGTRKTPCDAAVTVVAHQGVADDAHAFAATVVRLHGDETLWRELSDNGLRNITQHFSMDAARETVARVFLG